MSKEAAYTYAQLKIQAKQIEEKLKALQPEVLTYIQAAVPENQPAELSGMGNFTWYPKKTYTFSPEYDKLVAAADERKAEELAKGTYLSVVEAPILVFKVKKGSE